MHLTNDSKRLLYILYNEYINRRNHNIPKKRAVISDNAKSVQENFMPDELLEDVESYMIELENNNFLDNFYADGTIYYCNLTDFAICKMEELPKDTLLSITDFISKFIP